MLTDYNNKVLTPDNKSTDACPTCKGKDWRKVARKGQKYLVCKGCGHVRKGE